MTDKLIVSIGRMTSAEGKSVAELHYSLFADANRHGHSLAELGVDFLEKAFYKANEDNPSFFVDVARYRGSPIAFSVYTSDHRNMLRFMVRNHWILIVRALLMTFIRRPAKTIQIVLANRLFVKADLPDEVGAIQAWFILLGVAEPYRTREFQRLAGTWIATDLKQSLEMTLRREGCDSYWAAPSTENELAIRFYQREGAELIAQGDVQGTICNFYRLPVPKSTLTGRA